MIQRKPSAASILIKSVGSNGIARNRQHLCRTRFDLAVRHARPGHGALLPRLAPTKSQIYIHPQRSAADAFTKDYLHSASTCWIASEVECGSMGLSITLSRTIATKWETSGAYWLMPYDRCFDFMRSVNPLARRIAGIAANLALIPPFGELTPTVVALLMERLSALRSGAWIEMLP